MINGNEDQAYFQVKNNTNAIVVFGIRYMAGGTPIYAYSRSIQPGFYKRLNMPSDASDIQFTMYMLDPPYNLFPIFQGIFNTNAPRCYTANGTIQRYYVSRIPCQNSSDNDCCNCCCDCHCDCCHDSYYSDYNNPCGY